MEFSVKIEGIDKLKRSSKAVQHAVAIELQRGLFVGAKQVEKDAKESILSGDKSGRIYRRRTVTHRASAPGEAPASDTGRLVNSINTEMQSGALAALVKAGGGIVKYARALEFGTARMAARPFFHPALEKNRRFILQRLKDAVRRGMAKGSK